MRMMDRPIRPPFSEGFVDEVQIQAFVMSHDGQNDSDIVACNGASASLFLTDAPFQGPVATVRVARIMTDDGLRFVLNPTQAQLEFSDMDLVLSGQADGINMLEVCAAEVDEATMIEAIRFCLEEGIKPILEMMQELRAKCGAPETRMGEIIKPSDEVVAIVKKAVEKDLIAARK